MRKMPLTVSAEATDIKAGKKVLGHAEAGEKNHFGDNEGPV